MIPGDHQRSAVAAAREKTAHLGDAVLVLATGGGKTGLDHAAGGGAARTLQAAGAGEWLPRAALTPVASSGRRAPGRSGAGHDRAWQ